MRAIAVFPNAREVELIDAPEPKLASASDVKLRMLEAAIRDLAAFEQRWPKAVQALITGDQERAPDRGVAVASAGLEAVAQLVADAPLGPTGARPRRRATA